MSLGSRVRTWWRAMGRGADVDSQVEEELRFHIESFAEDLMRGGMPREEAARRAKADLGSIAAKKENCRQAWGTRWFDELRGDLRYAFRMMAKSPGFAAIGIGSLALGIGANIAIFSMTKAALLDSVGVPHPRQLRMLEWQFRGNKQPMSSVYGQLVSSDGGSIRCASFSYALYQALRKDHSVFEDLVAFFHSSRTQISWDGQVDLGSIEYVSGNFFSELGIRAVAGRTLLPADDQVGRSPVVVISDNFWRDHFERSPAVIGKTLKIDQVPMTIVGVAPPNFDGLIFDAHPVVMLPISLQPAVEADLSAGRLNNPEIWWLRIAGRIRPGVSDAQAQAALAGIFNQTAKATLKNRRHLDLGALHLAVTPGNQGENPGRHQFAQIDAVLTVMAALVLLLACANIASLLLARAAARQRELSVRMALGAGRSRLLRQALTEALLLSMLGGIAGTALGYACRNIAPPLLGQPRPDFDWLILGYALCLAIATGMLCGGIPAWRTMGMDAQDGLRETPQMTAKRTRSRLMKSSVALQIGLATLLLVGAGLFVRTLYNLSSVALGFQPQHLLLFDIVLPPKDYPAAADRGAAYEQVEDGLSAIPGVISVASSTDALIAGDTSTSNFDVDGQPSGERQAWKNIVGQDFFQTMDIPMLSGRGFGRQDTQSSESVAVINRELANQFFRGQNPIGQTFNTAHTRIIGICGDTRFRSLRDAPPPTYYLFTRQVGDYHLGTQMTFAVKTAADPDVIAASVRTVLHDFRRDLPVNNLRTQEEQIHSSLRQERLFASLTTVFGVLALVLACIGIYGIMVSTVSRRTNEIGLRMALGAEPGRVLRMVLGEATWIAAIGVVAGLGCALALGRLIASQLYGLNASDPATLLISAALLIAVALGASWIPARRAASVDPMRALRHE